MMKMRMPTSEPFDVIVEGKMTAHTTRSLRQSIYVTTFQYVKKRRNFLKTSGYLCDIMYCTNTPFWIATYLPLRFAKANTPSKSQVSHKHATGRLASSQPKKPVKLLAKATISDGPSWAKRTKTNTPTMVIDEHGMMQTLLSNFVSMSSISRKRCEFVVLEIANIVPRLAATVKSKRKGVVRLVLSYGAELVPIFRVSISDLHWSYSILLLQRLREFALVSWRRCVFFLLPYPASGNSRIDQPIPTPAPQVSRGVEHHAKHIAAWRGLHAKHVQDRVLKIDCHVRGRNRFQ